MLSIIILICNHWVNDGGVRRFKTSAVGIGNKPCPVAQPQKAEDYLRQNILKLYPAGTTVVSVAPFPELNEIVRKRQGLASGNDSTGSTRTEAVRMRLTYQKDGTDQEAWVAVAMVVNIYPSGRGSLRLPCHLANRYIMSNDPSFNPKEHLSGNWSQLEPVN